MIDSNEIAKALGVTLAVLGFIVFVTGFLIGVYV